MSLILSLITMASLALPLDDAAVIAAQLPLYPLDTCAVSGEPLGTMGDTLDVVHEGRLVRLCCEGCKKGLAKDPAAILARLDAAAIRQQQATYPLDVCLVSGKPFGGAMGDPIELVHQGRYVKLCCAGCTKRLTRDWTELLTRLDQATIAAQKDTYPLTTCVVSGEPLGAGAVDILSGVTLVRVCCKSCVKPVKASPAGFLDVIGAARRAAKESEGPTGDGGPGDDPEGHDQADLGDSAGDGPR